MIYSNMRRTLQYTVMKAPTSIFLFNNAMRKSLTAVACSCEQIGY